MNTLQAIRGMKDILPPETQLWQYLESVLRQVAHQYGYQEIRLPIVEKMDLFQRAIGQDTDVVGKEMYVFQDRNQDQLALRPEATASCVRAGLEHGLLYHQTQRWWYLGAMFRHERPQQGRYRQFHQFGAEVFGLTQPEIDAELILMNHRIWRLLNLEKKLTLHLNSLGSSQTRFQYRKVLIDYFVEHQDQLDADSKHRLISNPLRILDSKHPQIRSLLDRAPRIIDCLDIESAQQFERLKILLQQAGIDFIVNPYLVRGLDYYNKTVFEWILNDTTHAQNTVCAGGRYDGLVEQLGGRATPAIGFALGLERIVSLLSCNIRVPQIYCILIETRGVELMLIEQIRTQLPHVGIIVDGQASLKKQLQHADKSGANIALILGPQEIQSNTMTIKYLRTQQPQECVAQNQLIKRLTEIIESL
jgi:histidyl-tRNA synthetase